MTKAIKRSLSRHHPERDHASWPLASHTQHAVVAFPTIALDAPAPSHPRSSRCKYTPRVPCFVGTPRVLCLLGVLRLSTCFSGPSGAGARAFSSCKAALLASPVCLSFNHPPRTGTAPRSLCIPSICAIIPQRGVQQQATIIAASIIPLVPRL